MKYPFLSASPKAAWLPVSGRMMPIRLLSWENTETDAARQTATNARNFGNRIFASNTQLLALAPFWCGDNGLGVGDIGRVNDLIFPTLHLGNQDYMLVLAISIKLDWPKGSRRQVDVLDGIANLGAVS